MTIEYKMRNFTLFLDIIVNGPREPGVGAELVTSKESLNYQDELNQIRLSRVNSIASSEADFDDRYQDFEVSF